MTIIKKHRYLILTIMLLIWQKDAMSATLILTGPPRESPQEGKKLYGPLARHIGDLTGHKVVYKHPGNWLKYQRDMKRGKFDIVFDGPHFASWRIKHLNHTAVAKLPGTLQFHLVAMAANDRINIPRDMGAKKVCVIPPPNLSALLMLSRLDQDTREPVIKPARGGMKSVYKGLKSGKCETAMLRSFFYDKKLNAQQRSELKFIYSSPILPNQVITVGTRIKGADLKKITDSLTRGEGVIASQNIVKRFIGKQANALVEVQKNEYTGYSVLLEDVVMGWKQRKK